jgi:hypothetical protein
VATLEYQVIQASVDTLASVDIVVHQVTVDIMDKMVLVVIQDILEYRVSVAIVGITVKMEQVVIQE